MRPDARVCGAVFLLMAAAFIGCSTARVYPPAFNSAASADAIDLNTATVDELEKLPHLGRKTAEAVIQFRQANGPFRRPEDLMQVRGISEERFLELRPSIKTE